MFARLPEEFPLPPPEVELSGGTAQGLYDAFVAVMLRVEESKNPPPRTRVSRDSFTIGDRMAWITANLKKKRRLRFAELMAPAATKMEVVVTFMALLELLANGAVAVYQQGTFGEIFLSPPGTAPETEGETT